ncbi:MAG: calcium-translocating P-type ATPase, PMCA-type [Clostridia bacterium]|nr:calcium-translocating P-type ATPase, PMCA-type [Clostridia bacterium]
MSNQIKIKGLSDAEVAESAKRHGKNILTPKKKKSFLSRYLDSFRDPVIKILLVALAVNIVFAFRGGDVFESIGIGISVFLATFISTLSEQGSEAAFARLSEEYSNVSCKAYRNGRLSEIPISEIVVGDLLKISAGENVPADAFVTEGSIKVDQSSITGESREIEKRVGTKKELSPSAQDAVLRGSPVLEGEAEILVAEVGDSTMLGQISKEVQIDTRESPLSVRLAKLAKQISTLGYIAAILVGVATLFNTFVIDSGFRGEVILLKLRDTPYLLSHLLDAFMLSLTVLVMAVPEGLPMMIAVVLSSNIKRMLKGGVLVRKPVGIEAAGSMNILFTDKTGTLTEGKMSVSKIICADGVEFSDFYIMQKRAPYPARLFEINSRYNTSSDLSGEKIIGGNATDRALLSAVSKSRNFEKYKRSHYIPFDSSRKYSAASLYGKDTLTLIKGAPERLLPKITNAYTKNGSLIPFSSLSKSFLSKVNELTASGGRIIFIASCGGTLKNESIPDGLSLVCAVLLEDKIRKEAKKSVRSLRGAGIQVVMITGDNKDTARSIGEQCGIVTKQTPLVLTADELSRLSDEELAKALPTLAVVARALPSDKSRLVRVAQEKELVVGMTGDGINDAPALRRADIGFAMGSGTQVAKDAGDIIILDNDLASISKAVLFGRTIFKSIRKFITLQLTMNFSAVGISMICPFFGFDSPVTVVQMLWINIIMDTLGGLAFAGEAPKEHYMKEKPKRRDEPILSGYMVSQMATLALYSLFLCLAFLTLPQITSHFRVGKDNIYLLTAFFALFIFSSLFNCFNCRTDRLKLFSGLSENKAFIFIMLLVGTIQILFTYLGGSILRTAPLLSRELLYTLLLSLSVIPVDLTRKLVLRLFRQKQGF